MYLFSEGKNIRIYYPVANTRHPFDIEGEVAFLPLQC